MRYGLKTILLATFMASTAYAQSDQQNYSIWVDSVGLGGQLRWREPTPPQKLMVQLGISLRQISDWVIYQHVPLQDQTGMIADNLLAGLPAHQAGIEWHDIIAKVDGKPICTVEEFVKAYESTESDEVTIDIIKKGKVKQVTISKSRVEKSSKQFRIGVHVEDVPEALAKHIGLEEKIGLYVSQVVEGTPAQEAGVKSGDILLKANSKSLRSLQVLNHEIQESQGEKVEFELLQSGKLVRIDVIPMEDTSRFNASAANLTLANFYWQALEKPSESANAEKLQQLSNAVDKLTAEIIELRKELSQK